MQLITAITTQGAKHIAGQTFGVDPDQNRLVRADIALVQSKMLTIVNFIVINNRLKVTAEAGGDHGFSSSRDQEFFTHPVRDHIGNRHNAQIMLFSELAQLRHTGHGAVVIHDLTDHT